MKTSRILMILIVLGLVFSFTSCGNPSGPSGGGGGGGGDDPGDGSPGNPFKISDVQTLQRIGKGTGDWEGDWSLAAHYEQIANIDMEDEIFTPIGYVIRIPAKVEPKEDAYSLFFPFTGSYDGGGHTINNLSITDYENLDFLDIGATDLINNNLGFIGYMRDGLVKNLSLQNLKIICSQDTAGGIVAEGFGTITNCSVNGEIVSIMGIAAGIAGAFSGTISNSHFTGSIIGDADVQWSLAIGGIVGTNTVGSNPDSPLPSSGITISGSTVDAEIIGAISVGGIIGDAMYADSIISDCTFTGSVSGFIEVGGIAGVLGMDHDELPPTQGKISNCTVNADITGIIDVDEFAGFISSLSSIEGGIFSGEIIIIDWP